MTPADRFAGGLLGQAIGDALGAPVEGFDRAVCTQYIEEFLNDRATGHAWAFDGQYTDDTQLSRELVISFVANNGRWNPPAFAARISALFAEGQVRRPGRATSCAAERLRAGVSWHRAGEPNAAGNGAAMRAAPVGWLFAANSSDLVQVAVTQASITHQHSDAQAGAVAMAQAVALVMGRHQQDDRAFLDGISGVIRPLSPTFATDISNVRHVLQLPFEHAQAAVSGLVDTGEWAGTISPHSIPSVVWALYAYLRGRPTFLEVIRLAISGGGDTDTTAAMAGALIGAELGIEALPRDLVAAVHDQSRWRAEELIDLAAKLALSLSNR